MIIVGGIDKSSAFSIYALDNLAFNLEDNTFKTIKINWNDHILKFRRHHTTCLYGNNQIILFGGLKDGAVSDETYKITLEKGKSNELVY